MNSPIDCIRVDMLEVRLILLGLLIIYKTLGIELDKLILIALVFNQNRIVVKLLISE